MRRWLLRFVVLFSLLLVAITVNANAAVFGGGAVTGCSLSAQTYTCATSPTAGAEDISIAGGYTVTIDNGNGNFFGGAAALAADAHVKGNLSVQTTLALADSADVIGNVTTGTTVALATHAYVKGDLIAGTTVALAAGAYIEGNLTSLTTVALAKDAYVTGNLSAGTTLTLAKKAHVGKKLTAGTTVTLAADAYVLGDLTAGATVALAAGAYVQGNLTSTTSTVTLAAGAFVCGNLYAETTVTLAVDAYVTGNLTAGTTVTMAENAYVNGTLTAGTTATLAKGVCYGSLSVGGTTTAAAGVGQCPLPRPVTICSATPPAGSLTPGSFECLETGTLATWDVDTNTHRLYTKLASTPFAFEVVALKKDGTIETNYVASGGTAKNVTVELVDGNTICPSSTLIPAVSQTLNFAAADGGRKTTAGMTVNNANANVRCRVTDSNQSPSVVKCSNDNFSVRPGAVALATSASATAPSATAMPTIKAGANFALKAITSASSYSGVLLLDTGKLAAQTSSQVATQQSGGVIGTLTPSSLTANAAAVNATYSEVGHLYLAPGAYRDDSFTAVDSAVGDCITSTTTDNNLADTLIGGKYGCSIGNKTAVSLGRFIPDHFAISPSSVLAACTVGAPFSYFGQDGFTTIFTLTAQNAANGPTQNYAGGFAKLNLNNYAIYGFSAALLPAGSSLASSATAPSGNWLNGVASVSAKHQISRPTAATVETSITVSAAPTDGEVPAATTATAVGGATSLRYGQLKMQNAYGTELLALPIPLQAQYWNGTIYVPNTADSCTVIPMSSITMGNYRKQLNACETQLSPVGNVTMVAGKLPGTGLLLTKPGANNAGSVDLAINLSATTAGNTCVSGTESVATAANMPWFGFNPRSRATFGVYKSVFIYIREMY